MAQNTQDDWSVARVPIFRLKNEYYVYSSASLSQLRARHNIPGILSGTLPQAAQQNVFLGLPARLMAEEARILVEKGVAHVVDDIAAHKSMVNWFNSIAGREAREAWFVELNDMRLEAQRGRENIALGRRERALKRMGSAERERVESGVTSRDGGLGAEGKRSGVSDGVEAHSVDTFDTENREELQLIKAAAELPVITPSTSQPRIQHALKTDSKAPVPPKTSAYALYKYLHELPVGYFLSPGLRFGCQFMVYPGDPLRFHSHFLAIAKDWDEELNLVELIGGGRLGTGVKKGFLVGGEIVNEKHADGASNAPDVRCFCIEWAGM